MFILMCPYFLWIKTTGWVLIICRTLCVELKYYFLGAHACIYNEKLGAVALDTHCLVRQNKSYGDIKKLLLQNNEDDISTDLLLVSINETNYFWHVTIYQHTLPAVC